MNRSLADTRKILLVSSMVAGSPAVHLALALRELGQELRVVSNYAHPCVDARAYGLFDVSAWCKKNAYIPDVLLYIEGSSPFFPYNWEQLSCITAWWSIDSHIHPERHARIAKLFDLTLAAQKRFVDSLPAGGAVWLPLAAASIAATEPPPPDPAMRDLDIAYVGSSDRRLHTQRALLLDSIREKFKKVFLGPAPSAQLDSIYRRAKIVFNRSVKGDLNMRYFEAMRAGAVLVTNPIPHSGVELLFKEGEDFIVYQDEHPEHSEHSEHTLLHKLEALLADPVRLNQIGKSGYARISAEHTYLHRAQSTLRALSSTKRNSSPQPADFFMAYHSLDCAEGMLWANAQSLAALHRRRDKSRVLGLAVTILNTMARLLIGAYQWRYHLRQSRLDRKQKAAA